MHEGPARQNGAGNLLFVTRGVRDGAPQSARRYNAREQPPTFSASASSIAGRL